MDSDHGIRPCHRKLSNPSNVEAVYVSCVNILNDTAKRSMFKYWNRSEFCKYSSAIAVSLTLLLPLVLEIAFWNGFEIVCKREWPQSTMERCEPALRDNYLQHQQLCYWIDQRQQAPMKNSRILLGSVATESPGTALRDIIAYQWPGTNCPVYTAMIRILFFIMCQLCKYYAVENVPQFWNNYCSTRT